MDIRVGLGFDVHRLSEGEELWMGGIKIPHSKGTIAHSDGDVLIHAICDALLGAVCLGDLGTHFPDTSEEFKGIDSKILLKRVFAMVKEKNYRIVNIDSVISAQRPRIMPYVSDMRNSLANILETDPDRVSIKATTTERLGFEGREEGISARAVVLIGNSDL